MADTMHPPAFSGLFPGEVKRSCCGAPMLEYFVSGDVSKPLLVFIPGAGHLARISYGGHAGGSTEDFLAHWLSLEGYSFLALSYPLETAVAVFDQGCPEFDRATWGRQIAESAAQKVSEYGLPKRVVLLAWSMAGKSIQPACQYATELGLELMPVAMAASPHLPGFNPSLRRMPMAGSGYAMIPVAKFRDWHSQLSRGTEDPVPWDVYCSHYIGNGPVGLMGFGEVFRDGHFELDLCGAFAYSQLPLVAVLVNDSAEDSQHALTDRASWTLFNVNGLMSRYQQVHRQLDEIRWKRIRNLARALADDLCIEVTGNHFFFVGERAARTTAEAIVTAINRLCLVEGELESILHSPLNGIETPEETPQLASWSSQ